MLNISNYPNRTALSKGPGFKGDVEVIKTNRYKDVVNGSKSNKLGKDIENAILKYVNSTSRDGAKGQVEGENGTDERHNLRFILDFLIPEETDNIPDEDLRKIYGKYFAGKDVLTIEEEKKKPKLAVFVVSIKSHFLKDSLKAFTFGEFPRTGDNKSIDLTKLKKHVTNIVKDIKREPREEETPDESES